MPRPVLVLRRHREPDSAADGRVDREEVGELADAHARGALVERQHLAYERVRQVAAPLGRLPPAVVEAELVEALLCSFLRGLLDSLGRRGVDHDARERDPVMVFAACDPLHLPIRQHIHTSRLGMVVHVEDEPRARAALLRQSDHGVFPVPFLHQTAHKAQIPLL